MQLNSKPTVYLLLNNIIYICQIVRFENSISHLLLNIFISITFFFFSFTDETPQKRIVSEKKKIIKKIEKSTAVLK